MMDRKFVVWAALFAVFFAPKTIVFSEAAPLVHMTMEEGQSQVYKKPELPAGVIPAEPMPIYPRNQKVRIYKKVIPPQVVERVTIVEPVKVTRAEKIFQPVKTVIPVKIAERR